MKNKRFTKALVIIFFVLLVDQIVKIWIKTNMMIGDEYVIFPNWFIIHFVENNGMAFGFELSGNYGKLALSIFRIVAVFVIGWYLFSISKHKKMPFGYVASIALIFAGAVGNIIDSAFYGLIFNHSYGQVASFLPQEGGYADFLHGRVVDMLYFPLIEGRYPDWIPLKGGDSFIFFRPIFNIADSSITIGIFSIILFYSSIFTAKKNKNDIVDVAAEESKEVTEEI